MVDRSNPSTMFLLRTEVIDMLRKVSVCLEILRKARTDTRKLTFAEKERNFEKNESIQQIFQTMLAIPSFLYFFCSVCYRFLYSFFY